MLLADTQPTARAITTAPMNALAIIDRMPEGGEKVAFLMKQFEEARSIEEDERRAAEERRVVLFNADLAKINEQRAQNRHKTEMELTRANLQFKDRTVQELATALALCTDARERANLQGKLDLWSGMPTTVTYAVDKTAPEAPRPLAQAVIGTGSGAISVGRTSRAPPVYHHALPSGRAEKSKDGCLASRSARRLPMSELW